MASLRHGGFYGLSLRILRVPCHLSARDAAAGAARPQYAQPTSRCLCPRRLYATAPTSRSTGPPKEDLYRVESYPSSAFKRAHETVPNRVPQGLSPQQYHHITMEFFKAVHEGADDHAVNLKDQDISPQDMYETACFVLAAGPRYADYVAAMMSVSASALGCAPATLSSALRIIEAGRWGKANKKPLQLVESRFAKLLAKNPDSNTLFVEGKRLAALGNAAGATKAFERALQQDSTGFEWKGWCQLSLGQAYIKNGKIDEARRLFEGLAAQDVPLAHLELGKLLRPTDRDRAEHHLQMASGAMSTEAFSHLSEIAWEKCSEARDTKEQTKMQILAAEWSQLASTGMK